jgi:SAM-dependent methyltransferase
MTMDPEAHAARFDEKADEYDDGGSPEYRACVQHVVEHARDALGTDDVVLDLGTGTGAIALRLADDAGRVVGRDVSEGMLAEARGKADEHGLENVAFGEGRLRAPNDDGPVDVVVSNFAMHHLSDDEKREAIAVLDDLDPDRVVLGDVMLFGEPDPSEPFYDPTVDDPSTAGVLADAFTDAGFVLTAVEMVHDQAGVLVADRPAVVGAGGTSTGGD